MTHQHGLYRIQVHSLPCGCTFLVAFPETRRRHPAHDPARPLSARNERWEETHPAGDPLPFRVVTTAEAEEIVTRKREHEHWRDHVVPAGTQPPHGLCERHEQLPYDDATYWAVAAEHAQG